MNYAEIKAEIPRWTHRTDQADDIPQFIENVTKHINRRLGTSYGPLIADDDTNDILDNHPDIYLYGALRESAIMVHNAEATARYEGLFYQAINDLNVNFTQGEWGVPPLQITIYEPEVS